MNDSSALLKACDFAAKKHSTQRRKDPAKTPYINHPLGVAFKLTQHGCTDIDVLRAAILHDTIEDTDTTYDELVSVFGGKVADLVMEVTDDKSLTKDERKQKQIEHAPHISKGAQMVKLADKLYNLSDLCRMVPEGWSRERVQAYFAWAKKVISGIKGALPSLEEEVANFIETATFQQEGQIYKALIE